MARRKGGNVDQTTIPSRLPDGRALAQAVTAPVSADLAAHLANLANPHATTAAQVGAPDVATFNAHAPRHAGAGADPVTITGLAGFPGGTTTFLRADGSFAVPPGGGGGGSPTEQTTTLTGTQNNLSLSASFTYLRCNNASSLVITGFTVGGAAPAAGDRVVIDNVGPSTVKVPNEDAGSTATSRVITESVAGQIVGANGRMEAVYDGTTGRWRLKVIDPGDRIAVPYNAANFTGGGAMTWTVDAGDQLRFAYRQRGITLELALFLNVTTIGGTAAVDLRVALPGGFTGRADGSGFGWAPGAIWLRDVPGYAVGFSVINASATYLQFYRADQATWALQTNVPIISFASLAIPIN